MLKKPYLAAVLLPVAMLWGSLAHAFTDGIDRSVTLEKTRRHSWCRRTVATVWT